MISKKNNKNSHKILKQYYKIKINRLNIYQLIHLLKIAIKSLPPIKINQNTLLSQKLRQNK